MATITDSGATLKITNGSKIDYVNKTGINITVNGDTIFIEELDGEQHSFLFSEVTSPSEASAEALATSVIALIANTLLKDQESNITTTLSTVQPIPDLTVTLQASKKYRFIYDVHIGQDNTAGIRFTLAAPSGASIKGHYLASTTGATVQASVNFTSFSEFAVVQNAANDNGFIKITGVVTLSTTAGDMTIGYRSATATQTSKIFEGSWVEFTKID